ncbi:MAG: hypothetical protein JO345_16170 [Streptosporangiaceae bacterium]|nr:hypothetical protein [Streptosporangiaceae bacterium]
MTGPAGQPGPTSLAAVAAYLPETSLGLEKAGEVLGLTDGEIRKYRRFFGLDRVRWDPAARQMDLLVAAAGRLAALRGSEHRVRYVIHARTIEPAGPYSANPVRQAALDLGLEHATSFTLSQHACASGLLAVVLAGRMLAAERDQDSLALVLTGEKTYPHVAKYMPPAMVMGEAAAACLVGRGTERDRLLAYVSRTYGDYHVVTTRSGELATRFEHEYPQALAELIRSAVEQAGIGLADLRLVLPHNVNRISWTRVCRLMDLPVERIFLDYVPVTGHCFCADPFINYARACELGLLRPGDHYLMASVGLGATFSALVFRH